MMNKLLVVTGGSRGIGKAIVRKFAMNNFDVITCARNEEDLEKLKKEVGKEAPDILVGTMKADLSQKQEVLQFAEYVRTFQRPVDVLINNTGVFIPGEVHAEPDGNLELMINTNLYSAYHLTRSIIPMMLDSGHGDIFNVCSVASIIPYANGGSYAISKYAMYGMTKVLREEMKKHNIRVTAVLPGATRTASWDGVDLPDSRFIKVEDVADAIFGAYSLSKNSVVEDILIRPQEGDI